MADPPGATREGRRRGAHRAHCPVADRSRTSPSLVAPCAGLVGGTIKSITRLLRFFGDEPRVTRSLMMRSPTPDAAGLRVVAETLVAGRISMADPAVRALEPIVLLLS